MSRGRVERSLEVEATLASVRPVARWLAESSTAAGLAFEVAFGLDLAVHEAVENVIRYAWSQPGPHRVALAFRSQAGSVEVEVCDDGRPFDPSAVNVTAEGEDLEGTAIGGRGIRLMRRFTDELRYRREGGRNRLTLVGRKAGSAP